MKQMNRDMKVVFLVITGILVFGLGGFIPGYFFHNKDKVEKITRGEEPAEKAPTIAAHISGEVAKPGVYYLEEGSRVDDAIKKAGILEGAQLDKLNLAAYVNDGEKIYVPGEEEKGTDSNLININTAGAEELSRLPGIGEATAAKIVAERDKNGYFVEVEELLDISGIGESKLEDIKPLITLY